MEHRHHHHSRQRIRNRLVGLGASALGAGALAFGAIAATEAIPASAHRPARPTGSFAYKGDHRSPVSVTVFSPGAGDHSGANGVGFIVDLALDATKVKYNALLSPAAGYKPYFNDPTSPTFHPGPDPGAPGLVVMLSTTPDKAGTPFQGPRTNLAGLFQINGVAKVNGGKAEVWDTWQPGKAIFGSGRTTLTVFVVKGTAPALVPSRGLDRISNVVRVPFSING
jgi:hypothetical protein